ncbi:MAG TPA: response regulator [Kofleriaceae bacterium]|jgi:CheY-like chemotaxis protein|nr:response regulator [Kofleriaceae bacterium]
MAKLLLLDDELEALEWLAAALGVLGHEVRSYLTGRLALAHLSEWRPDLIIADILMPEMDGLAFARLVRAHGGPPVLFISIAMKRAEAILAGAVGYVQKPATAEEVRAEVERVLGREARRARVLVVDDDPDTRELYRIVLEPSFDVEDAEHGAIALTLLRQRPFNLVITDIHMPVMNGVALIRAIRMDPALEQIPIIVETSDRAALTSPVWRELNVASRIDKLEFLRWLDRHINARLRGQP